MMLRAALPALLLALAAAGPASAQAPAPAEVAADVANAERVVGPPRGPKLAGERLEAETKRVGALLRCPVCQGLSVADSPASMAVNMRHQVRDLLAAGYTEEQILGYFERSYGEFVRLDPPLRGVNWTLWLAPAGGLLAGGVLVLWVLRGQRSRATQAGAAADAPVAASPGPVPADPLPDDPELAACVLRVRERAYGWPGGVRPEASR